MSNQALSRRRFLASSLAATAAGAGLAGAVPTAALADGNGILRIAQGGDRLLQAIDGMPWIAEGNGVPVYVLMSQNCAFCKALWQDHQSALASIEFRWIPGPYGTDNVNQTTQVMKTRRLADFAMYMAKTLPASDARQDDQKVALYNAAIKAVNTIYPILTANGGRTGTPRMIWAYNGVAETAGGFTPEILPQLVRHLSA
jgi:hypothetical protein